MNDYLRKKMLSIKLAEELQQYEENEDNKKQSQFIEKLQKLLNEHDYTFTDLNEMISSVVEPSVPRRSSTKKDKSAGQGQEIEYEGVVYKVNAIGRQPRETKELLDSLDMTPTEFIANYKKQNA